MSRLNKADDIIELGLMLQSSSCGISIDDIAERFECSRRSAERMKTVLFEKFPEKVEVKPVQQKPLTESERIAKFEKEMSKAFDNYINNYGQYYDYSQLKD